MIIELSLLGLFSKMFLIPSFKGTSRYQKMNFLTTSHIIPKKRFGFKEVLWINLR